ncbi:MAG: hypothetical protein RSA27_05155, partial [Oscillospiraceae bacterium]
INKEKYKVSPAYEKLEDRYKKVVEPGLVGTFYFNFDGQIIVIDTNNDNTILAGFVINGGVVKSGLDKTYGLKMLTENNAVEMLNLEDKVIIDGSSSKKSAEEAVKKFTENIGGNVGFQKKLILYKVNKAGNITAIDFPQTKESTIDPREDSLYINFRKEKKRKMMYRSGPKSFEAFAYIDQKVKVFKVGPLDNQNQMAEIDDEDYVFGGESMFQDQYTYTIDTFTNTREGLMSNYVILYPQSAGDAIPKIPRFLVFEDLVKGLDEKGNEVLKVSGFVAGQKINYTVKDSSSAAKLLETGTVKPGDTLVFGTDEKNRLTALELVYDMANNVFFPNNPSDGVSTDYTMMYAIPLKERDGLYEVEVTSKNGDSAIYMYKPASFSVLVYDKNEKHNKAYKGSPSDIVTKEQSPDNYSKLLLSTTWAVPSDMIVYK